MAWLRAETVAIGLATVFASTALWSSAIDVRQVAAPGVGTDNLPPRTGIWPVNYTFYGSAGGGWGFASSPQTNPGPTIRVFRGDIVNLTLISTDPVAIKHTWFVDYDGNNLTNEGEPSSTDFTSAQPLIWNFSADRPGSWVYKCAYHQTSMTGAIVVLADPRPVNLTLYGSAAGGWGFAAANQSNPGPPLVFLSGTNVTFTLISTDQISVNHTWFVDFDGNNLTNGAEPHSGDFNSAQPLVWNFTADGSGFWVYKCAYHPTSMTGSILVLGGAPPPPPRVGIPLITGIMVGALGIVLVFAAVYHVRAVRAAKRAR